MSYLVSWSAYVGAFFTNSVENIHHWHCFVFLKNYFGRIWQDIKQYPLKSSSGLVSWKWSLLQWWDFPVNILMDSLTSFVISERLSIIFLRYDKICGSVYFLRIRFEKQKIIITWLQFLFSFLRYMVYPPDTICRYKFFFCV